MTFKKDLALGNKYELLALDYFNYDSYSQSIGVFKPYDLLLIKDGVSTTVEVKCDRLAINTGNIAVEVECNGIPSGVEASTADYFVYFVIHGRKHYCYKIPLAELKNVCNIQTSSTERSIEALSIQIAIVKSM